MRYLFLALLLGVSRAEAAQTSLSIIISSPPSTAVSCTVNYPSGQTSFVAPVAPATQIATCTVTPSNWSGVLATGGADAASFAMSGMNVVVGSSAITVARTYNINVSATP